MNFFTSIRLHRDFRPQNLSDMSDTQDAARRLTPVAFRDPCPSPPLRSVLVRGLDQTTVPLVEQSNWSWRSRTPRCTADYFELDNISPIQVCCEPDFLEVGPADWFAMIRGFRSDA